MSFIGGDVDAMRDAAHRLATHSRAADGSRDWFGVAAALSGLHCDPEWSAAANDAAESIELVANTARQVGELLTVVADGLEATSWRQLTGMLSIFEELIDVELAALGIEPDEERTLDARVAANRIRIRADLDETTDPTRRALLQSWLDPYVDPITGELTVPQILLYDGNAGRVAVAFGDVLAADDVIVTVPGTGTTIDAYALGTDMGGETNRAVAILRRTTRLAGVDVAAIAWLGYDAPGWVDTNNPATSGSGEAGGLLLHGFVDGLGLDARQRLSVIGHSYGSFVVGEALSDGLHPDNTIVLGSPGMGVDHVGDLGVPPDADVFAMRATMDPVGHLERFGTSPTSYMFGATRLAAHTDTVAFSHSDYWDDANLTQIALAVTDGDPEIQRITSTGDVVHEGVMTPVRVGDDIVDQLQRPLPWFLEDRVDETQTAIRSVVGGVAATGAHTVDMAVDAGGEAVEWIGDRVDDGVDGVRDAASWTGDRIGDGVDAAGDAADWVGDRIGGLFD